LESFKQCISNEVIFQNVTKMLYAKGLTMGDLAKLVGAVETAG
jgi:hypothetical protein